MIKHASMIAVFNLILPFFVCNFISLTNSHECEEDVDPEEQIDSVLESNIVGAIKVWHVLMIIIALIIIATVVLCCFMRCRIPRTKQEIEADTVRKKVTKQFRKHLNKIPIEGMELVNVLKEVKQYEEQRLKEGTVEEKRTFYQQLKALFKSEKSVSIDEPKPGEEDEDVEQTAISKQVSIELEEVLNDGQVIKAPLTRTDQIDIESGHHQLGLTTSGGSGGRESFSVDDDNYLTISAADRKRYTLKEIVQDEIKKERMINFWKIQRQDPEFIEDIQEMAFRTDSGLQIDKKDLKRLRKASKKSEKEEKKEAKKKKIEEEKRLKKEEEERKLREKLQKEEDKRIAKEMEKKNRKEKSKEKSKAKHEEKPVNNDDNDDKIETVSAKVQDQEKGQSKDIKKEKEKAIEKAKKEAKKEKKKTSRSSQSANNDNELY